MPLADARLSPPAADTAPRLFALVPCAGVGERSGADGPKQYAVLMNRSLVAHTLAALAEVPGAGLLLGEARQQQRVGRADRARHRVALSWGEGGELHTG